MLVAFLLRSDAELTVQRDRSPNCVRLSNGDIRNSYTLKILNKRREEAHFRLSVEGLPSAVLGSRRRRYRRCVGIPDLGGAPRRSRHLPVLVTVPSKDAPAGSKPITFEVREASQARRASHDAVFVGPAR